MHRVNHFFFLLIAAAMLLRGASMLHAEDLIDSTRVYDIGEVTVTGKVRHAETRSSAPLQILSAEKIGQLQSLQISDALKYFSGVVVKDYGGIGGLKTISVRSLGAAHTAVCYDGIPLSDVQTGQIDLGRFAATQVESITLSSGQSDNIFVPARLFAAGSVLNLRTASPAFKKGKTVNANIALRSGSFGLLNASGDMQFWLSPVFSTYLRAEWLAAEGKYPYLLNYGGADDSTSTELRQNTDVRNVRLETGLHAYISDKEKAWLKIYLYDSQRGLPGATVFYNTENFSSQRIHDHTFFIQSHYRKEFSEKWSVQSNLKYNRGQLFYFDPAYHDALGRLAQNYLQQETYGSFSALYNLMQELSFSAASDFIWQNLHSDSQAVVGRPEQFSLLSVVAAKYVHSQLLVTGSVLHTAILEKSTPNLPGTNHNRLSPYLSLSVKPLADYDLRFRAFYKNIFRMPTFNDLYYAPTNHEGLKPENADQFNLGMTYQHPATDWLKSLSFTADVYHNRVTDKIVAYPTKNIFIWSVLNLGEVSITGADLTFETVIEIADGIQAVMGGSYTYQRALDVTDPDGRTYEHQLPYTPRISGSGNASLNTPWVDLAWSVVWSGKRYAGFQNYAEYRLPGFADHSVSVARDFKFNRQSCKVQIEALNITNKSYAVVRYFPMPGRQWRVNVNYRF